MLLNDNNGDTASSENVKTVNIIIDDVNSNSNNIVSGQAGNSSVANHSTASMNDNSTSNNISCDNSHTSSVNSNKNDNNVISNSNSSDAINNCVNDNDNNGSITWDDVVAMDASMARTARRSDRLQQSYIQRRSTRASAKSKT